MSELDRLEVLRRLPKVWLQLITTTRDVKERNEPLAWSLTIAYTDPAGVSWNAQYTAVDLNTVLDGAEQWLRNKGAMEQPTKRKLKLKRRTS